MRLRPNTLLVSRYRVSERLAVGDMSEVWVGEHTPTGAAVALKVLLPEAVRKADMVARFKREAFLLGKIQSDHVARVLDMIEVERLGPILVMDLIDGRRLHDVLHQKGCLTVEETVELGADLAHALLDLHRAEVIHRDLKPANILLKELPNGELRAMVVDFGLGRLVPGAKETSDAMTGITGARMALGTVEYMAPEQILSARDVTSASDVYALGAILYRAVLGRHVFEGSEGQIAHRKLTNPPPDVMLERTDALATGLGEVISIALRRNPRDRYPSTKDLVVDLSHLRDMMRVKALVKRASRPDLGSGVDWSELVDEPTPPVLQTDFYTGVIEAERESFKSLPGVDRESRDSLSDAQTIQRVVDPSLQRIGVEQGLIADEDVPTREIAQGEPARSNSRARTPGAASASPHTASASSPAGPALAAGPFAPTASSSVLDSPDGAAQARGPVVPRRSALILALSALAFGFALGRLTVLEGVQWTTSEDPARDETPSKKVDEDRAGERARDEEGAASAGDAHRASEADASAVEPAPDAPGSAGTPAPGMPGSLVETPVAAATSTATSTATTTWTSTSTAGTPPASGWYTGTHTWFEGDVDSDSAVPPTPTDAVPPPSPSSPPPTDEL